MTAVVASAGGPALALSTASSAVPGMKIKVEHHGDADASVAQRPALDAATASAHEEDEVGSTAPRSRVRAAQAECGERRETRRKPATDEKRKAQADAVPCEPLHRTWPKRKLPAPPFVSRRLTRSKVQSGTQAAHSDSKT